MLLLGNDYLFWLESATAGTFNFVKGQGSWSESRSAAKIDGSDKTTQGFALQGYGLTTWTGSLDIKCNLPDVNGFSRLETKCKAQPAAPFLIQIRKNGTAGVLADAVFAASVYGVITSINYNKDGTVDVKVEFGLAAAPTVDTIA